MKEISAAQFHFLNHACTGTIYRNLKCFHTEWWHGVYTKIECQTSNKVNLQQSLHIFGFFF